MEKSNRIEKWDILKFFLIFLVVLGHVIEAFKDDSGWMNGAFIFIYSFHMPVFFFVSGLFSKKNINEKRYNKITVFIFLFFITKLILFLSRIIAYKNVSISFTEIGDLPWYMLAMFVFQLITIGLKKFSPAYVFPLIIAIACVAGYDYSIGDTFAAMRMIVFYPFFYAGYCLEPQSVMKVADKKYVKAISAVVLILFAVLVFTKTDFLYQFKPLLTGRRAFDSLGKYKTYGCVLRFIYYLGVFVIGGAVVCLTPNKLSKHGIIARFGSRSIQVYMLHYSLIHIFDGRIKNLLPEINPAILFIVLAVIFTLICSLKIWEPIFRIFMNPETFLKKKESK